RADGRAADSAVPGGHRNMPSWRAPRAERNPSPRPPQPPAVAAPLHWARTCLSPRTPLTGPRIPGLEHAFLVPPFEARALAGNPVGEALGDRRLSGESLLEPGGGPRFLEPRQREPL